MARNVDPFDALTEQWEPELRKAFIAAIQEINDHVFLSTIEAMIREGDIDGAIKAVGVDDINFRGLDAAITAAFMAAAGMFADRIISNRNPITNAVIWFYFDPRALRAESWPRAAASSLISKIVADQNAMLRTAIVARINNGESPASIARKVVGVMQHSTKHRFGGLLGLTMQQEEWERSYANALASTDPAVLRKALERGLRDKRFDGAIIKAIRTGEPIPADIRSRMVLAYRHASLNSRALKIAQNETAKTIGAAQTEVFQQAIDRGHINADQLVKIPITAHDERVRLKHTQIERMNKGGVGWYEPYKVPVGMSHQMHAPYEGESNCRCREKILIKYRDR